MRDQMQQQEISQAMSLIKFDFVNFTPHFNDIHVNKEIKPPKSAILNALINV